MAKKASGSKHTDLRIVHPPDKVSKLLGQLKQAFGSDSTVKPSRYDDGCIVRCQTVDAPSVRQRLEEMGLTTR